MEVCLGLQTNNVMLITIVMSQSDHERAQQAAMAQPGGHEGAGTLFP